MSALNLAVSTSAAAPVTTISPSGPMSLGDLAGEHRPLLETRLADEGAILLRGFDQVGLEAFNAFGSALSSEPLDYVYRSTPRTAALGKVFTASEYPPDQHIPLHNENAYQRAWPLRVAFYCRTPSTSGGRTPFADMRQVTAAIPGDLAAKFGELGVRYHRNYYDYMDIPWQTVFQTKDRHVVEDYCRAHGLDFAWRKDGSLATSQLCQGLARHPASGDVYFFNQAHLFHVSSIGEEAAKMFIESFGLEGVPRHATFGDGAQISPGELAAVREAFAKHACGFDWMRGDVLLLDNMRMAHGREPFSGPREVFAMLLDLHEGAAYSANPGQIPQPTEQV